MVAIATIGVGCGAGGGTPAALRGGRDVYADRCSSCHGASGKGGVGPALDNVLETWPSCDDHQLWISLGTEGWKSQRGPTYGANATAITQVMPGHADVLTPIEIASVAAFERIQYGKGDMATELAACGVPAD
jgi:mono/diheme cytochrome c family protein